MSVSLIFPQDSTVILYGEPYYMAVEAAPIIARSLALAHYSLAWEPSKGLGPSQLAVTREPFRRIGINRLVIANPDLKIRVLHLHAAARYVMPNSPFRAEVMRLSAAALTNKPISDLYAVTAQGVVRSLAPVIEAMGPTFSPAAYPTSFFKRLSDELDPAFITTLD